MSTAIEPGQKVLLIERRGETHVEHDALVLGFTMDPALVGTKGEPAVEAVMVNVDTIKFGGRADWHTALLRAGDVVHSSHKDWNEGRVAMCYQQPAVDLDNATPIAPIELAAHTAHEANRILCAMFGDMSQPTWENAPDEIKASALVGAKLIDEAPATTPEQSHESWSAHKLAEGWTFGPVKDMEKKTHPCLVPYAELEPKNQIKDFMFGAVTRAVLGHAQLPMHAAPTQPAAPAQVTQPAHVDPPPPAQVTQAEAENAGEAEKVPENETDAPAAEDAGEPAAKANGKKGSKKAPADTSAVVG